MALLHPADRVPTSSTGRKLHPAIGLVGGFGFIIGMALAVHVVFGLVT